MHELKLVASVGYFQSVTMRTLSHSMTLTSSQVLILTLTIFQTLTLIYTVSYLDFLFPSTFIPESEKSTARTFVTVELSVRGT